MVSDRYLAQHQLEEIIADAMREVCFYYSDYSGYSRAVPCCTMLHHVAPCCTLATQHKHFYPQSLAQLGQLLVKAFHSRR